MIILYTRDGCSVCDMAKEALKNKNEAYLEYKIGVNIEREDVLAIVEEHSLSNALPVVKLPTRYGNYVDLLDYLFPPLKD